MSPEPDFDNKPKSKLKKTKQKQNEGPRMPNSVWYVEHLRTAFRAIPILIWMSLVWLAWVLGFSCGSDIKNYEQKTLEKYYDGSPID